MIARFTTAALLAITALTASATIALADARHDMDRIACRLTKDTDVLVQEAAIHYRHTPQYPHLISDAVQMKRLADHIHAIARHGSIGHLKHDVNELARLFRHVDGLIREIERCSYRGGHIHGSTFHISRGLGLIETDIRLLQSYLHVLCNPTPVHRPVYTAPVVTTPIYNKPVHFTNGHSGHNHGGRGRGFGAPGANNRGNGFTIQKGNVTFRFGF